jgi:hypothetical protein
MKDNQLKKIIFGHIFIPRPRIEIMLLRSYSLHSFLLVSYVEKMGSYSLDISKFNPVLIIVLSIISFSMYCRENMGNMR